MIDSSSMQVDQKPMSKGSNTSAETAKVPEGTVLKEGVKAIEEATPVVEKPPPLTHEERVEQMYIEEMGFTALVEDILKVTNGEKVVPFVAHNCGYDLCFFYHQFIADLPPTLKEFQQEWNKRFPHTYDNKILFHVRDQTSGLFDPTNPY